MCVWRYCEYLVWAKTVVLVAFSWSHRTAATIVLSAACPHGGAHRRICMQLECAMKNGGPFILHELFIFLSHQIAKVVANFLHQNCIGCLILDWKTDLLVASFLAIEKSHLWKKCGLSNIAQGAQTLMEAPRYSITTSNSQPIGNYFNMEHNNQMFSRPWNFPAEIPMQWWVIK